MNSKVSSLVFTSDKININTTTYASAVSTSWSISELSVFPKYKAKGVNKPCCANCACVCPNV